MKVLGLDLSLTSPAVVLVEDGKYIDFFNPKSKGTKDDTYREDLDRIDDIATRIGWWARGVEDIEHPIDLAVIEAPSFGSRNGKPHERAGLWWSVVRELDKLGIPVVQVAPATRAKYITGSGRADKKLVLAKARERYGELTHLDEKASIPNDDVADALGLADMGARSKGEGLVPDELIPVDCMTAYEGAVKKW